MKNFIIKATCLFVLASPSLAADSTQSEDPELRQEILKWMHDRDSFAFTGTVEFELIRQQAPDPERGAVMTTSNFQRQFLDQWSTDGVKVIQGWRIHVFNPRKIRTEVSFGSLSPRPPDGESPVVVTVRNEQQMWQWDSKRRNVFRDGPEGADHIVSELLDQAQTELDDIFDIRRASYLSATLVSARIEGPVVVAEIESARRASSPKRVSRLEFVRSPSGLLLKRTLCKSASRYLEQVLDDYRPVGGRMIAFDRVFRYGPIEEFDRPNREREQTKIHKIRSIQTGLDTEQASLFQAPAIRAGVPPEAFSTQYSYEEITGPGRAPFMIGVNP